ncbi:COG1361 family protein [Capillimicrobium parvum]|uniref:DUF11 domain-containing protein n=1 Tax=Capillimicrobium parvum TaxID=2884022 RepID=A0A9E6Y1M5_9ACTN|nr:hypothetical protein [Capillimicrobium parvum]UGS38003.1 hypothetical protein DSM104329_04425 [Capillimicrobium parvum]
MRGVLALTACCALLAGCGGGERQDHAEKSATYDLDVVSADFPKDQSISAPAELTIAVRNTGDRTIPNLAVSLDGISSANDQPGLADARQPVWIVADSPTAADTAYDFTWTVGKLDAGATKSLTWRLTPATPGTHSLTWTVAAGLHGKAKARTKGGGLPTGKFTVRVSDAPAQATVDPQTGDVVDK